MRNAGMVGIVIPSEPESMKRLLISSVFLFPFIKNLLKKIGCTGSTNKQMV